MFTCTSDHPIFECPSRALLMERTWKLNNQLAPNCPRCASSNTKFCYYNNYSLSQPRYFCKGCRRYWTKGGSLRNVPVGGGCRKSRRSKSARQAERLGSNYHMPSPGSTSNDSDSSAADGVNIDLADVFAKFLNQDTSSDDKVVTEQESSSGASSTSPDLPPSSLDTESDQTENIMFESRLQPSDLIYFGDNFHDYDQGLPQFCLDEENVQELLDQNALDQFQAILGDDIGWADGTSLPNFELQNVVQFQDLGPFSTDDQTKFASNVACENWCSFDLSGYEISSRP